MKVRPNGMPKDVPEEKTLEQIGRALIELGEFAEGYGQQVRLAEVAVVRLGLLRAHLAPCQHDIEINDDCHNCISYGELIFRFYIHGIL